MLGEALDLDVRWGVFKRGLGPARRVERVDSGTTPCFETLRMLEPPSMALGALCTSFLVGLFILHLLTWSAKTIPKGWAGYRVKTDDFWCV